MRIVRVWGLKNFSKANQLSMFQQYFRWQVNNTMMVTWSHVASLQFPEWNPAVINSLNLEPDMF